MVCKNIVYAAALLIAWPIASLAGERSDYYHALINSCQETILVNREIIALLENRRESATSLCECFSTFYSALVLNKEIAPPVPDVINMTDEKVRVSMQLCITKN